MTDFRKTQPAGRMIARLFARGGWAIVVLGVALAVIAALLGRFPGTGGAQEAVSVLSRVVAALPGIVLALFGLFSVMMAAQTRAVIDSADIAREMLALARRRPISLLAAIPPIGEEEAPVRRDPQSRDALRTDEGTPAPASPTAHVPLDPPLSEGTLEEPVQVPSDARRELRAEPVFATSSRLKPASGKIHPIFSARPPR